MENITEEDITMRPGVFIKTFGCLMNEYDSGKLITLLSGTHRQVATAEAADLILVNTCSIREKGEHKLFSLLGELRERKIERPELIIGVAGCVAQQEGEELLKRSPYVDFVVGTHNLSLVPRLVKDCASGKSPQVAVDYRADWEELPAEFESTPSRSSDRSVRALIAIQRGCDKHCSYCVVPNTRGPEVSRAPSEILREIRGKVAQGAREVILLGQTVNSYGRDLTPRYSFAQLIRAIGELEGIRRIRFTSPHPQDVNDEFLNLYREVPQLARHIHLPIQSGSDRILKLMNRNYRRSRYFAIVSALRERCPEIAISTDIIVGFPTESPEDFADTLAVVEELRFVSSYCFKYSSRPGTTAESQFGALDRLDTTTVDERFQRLLNLQLKISADYHSSLVGHEVSVLIEGVSKRNDDALWGRTTANVSTEVQLGSGKERDKLVGEEMSVTVNHASPHGLRAVLR